MNNKYFNVKDNKYIVIEDSSDLIYVKSNQDIEEILNLENKIELLEKELTNNSNKIDKIKKNIFLKKKFNNLIIYLELFYVIIAFYSKVSSFSFIISTSILSMVIMQFVANKLLGNVNNNRKLLNDYREINKGIILNINNKKLVLEKEKNINQYEKDNIISLIEDNYEVKENYNDIENTKVKKLILTKPNKN